MSHEHWLGQLAIVSEKTYMCLQEWSYLRGGLSTIDRDYGIFNKIHHDIGTHVLHHLFPQVCSSSSFS